MLFRTTRHSARFFFTGLLALFGFISCGGDSPTSPTPPPGPSCTFQVAPRTQTVDAPGASVTVTVTTTAQCSWTARTDADWITIVSGAAGTGPGTVNLTVAANPASAAREGGITVANQSVRFTQRARTDCAYDVTSESHRMGSDGGRGIINVATTPGCRWDARSSEPWLTLGRTSGEGSAQIEYVIAPYTGTVERAADVSVADRTIRLRQDPPSAACDYSAAPADFQLHWHHTGGEFRVVTRSGCTWTVRSTADWLTVPGPQERTGEAAVTFGIGTYTAESFRSAPIEVRWPAATAGQNIWITQGGCRYGMPAAQTVGAAGGPGQATVVTQPMSADCNLGCPWTATSTVPWIKITNPTGAGDDLLRYTVDPNPGPGNRSGEILLEGRKLVITQTF